ncbi:hypothetical protein CTI12_AA615680 [Artemisia annua]|uniref:Uncharacterized protein n=1 Tax=Artemisia annua TaxID=35608 RepID=A0A2U1KDE8_ARTAN|nr:hypothetical protein CTI12_AA615680 [Artemisia annua]
MEQKQSLHGVSVCHQLPPLSAKHPWFVAQNLGADEDNSRDQYFYTLHEPLTKYQCQIPELLGRCIRGYYHELKTDNSVNGQLSIACDIVIEGCSLAVDKFPCLNHDDELMIIDMLL